jgi:hypothetical protein
VAGTPGILLGKGTTGLIANDTNANPTITIEEAALDSGGNHLWDPSAPAPTVNAAWADG